MSDLSEPQMGELLRDPIGVMEYNDLLKDREEKQEEKIDPTMLIVEELRNIVKKLRDIDFQLSLID